MYKNIINLIHSCELLTGSHSYKCVLYKNGRWS